MHSSSKKNVFQPLVKQNFKHARGSVLSARISLAKFILINESKLLRSMSTSPPWRMCTKFTDVRLLKIRLLHFGFHFCADHVGLSQITDVK